MLKRGVWMVLVWRLLVLATPRTGSAGIGELIWEMSGPQFVGGGIQCKFTLQLRVGNLLRDVARSRFSPHAEAEGEVSTFTRRRAVRVHGEGLEWRHVRTR